MDFYKLLDRSRPLDRESALLHVAAASYEALFEQQGVLEAVDSIGAQIPKVLHIIWLGGAMPPHFSAVAHYWEQMHPAWEVLRWTETEIEALRPPLKNIEAFNAAPNAAEASDIARYELLYRFGGVYVDVDFVPLQPLDGLLGRVPNAGAILGLGNVGRTEVLNGFIAVRPRHPLMLMAISKIRRLGLINASQIAAYLDEDDRRNLVEAQRSTGTIQTTGPVMLSKVALEIMRDPERGASHRILILPHAFLSPMPNTVDIWAETTELGDVLSRAEASSMPGVTVAVHTWARSWQDHPFVGS